MRVVATAADGSGTHLQLMSSAQCWEERSSWDIPHLGNVVVICVYVRSEVVYMASVPGIITMHKKRVGNTS